MPLACQATRTAIGQALALGLMIAALREREEDARSQGGGMDGTVR